MRKSLICFLVLVFVVFSGCNTEKSKRIVIAITDALYIEDPHFTNWSNDSIILSKLTEPLVKKTNDYSILPNLSYRWYSPKKNVWVFELHKNVYFHNGKELTSYIVKANFERIKSIGIKSPYSYISEIIESIEAIGRYRVKFVLKKTPSNFLRLISDIKIIYLKDGTSKNELRRKKLSELIGTGSYKFYKRDKYKIVLKRNDKYWKRKGRFNEIVYVYNYLKNKNNFLPEIIFSSSPIDFLRKTYIEKKLPTNNVFFFVLNSNRKCLNSSKFRKFISKILHSEIIKSKLSKFSPFLFPQLVPHWLQHYISDFDFFTEETLEIDDKCLNKRYYLIYKKNNFIHKELARDFILYLNSSGFLNMKILGVSSREWRKRIFFEPDFDFTFFGYGSDTGGVDDVLRRIFHSRSKTFGTLNFLDFGDNRIDYFIDIAEETFDHEKKYEFYKKAHRLALESSILVPLFVYIDYLYIKREISGKLDEESLNFLLSI